MSSIFLEHFTIIRWFILSGENVKAERIFIVPSQSSTVVPPSSELTTTAMSDQQSESNVTPSIPSTENVSFLEFLSDIFISIFHYLTACFFVFLFSYFLNPLWTNPPSSFPDIHSLSILVLFYCWLIIWLAYFYKMFRWILISDLIY